MKNKDIINIAKKQFPESSIQIIKSRTYFHSSLYIIHVSTSNVQSQKYAIKIYKEKDAETIKKEYSYMMDFYSKNHHNLVSSPRPITIDVDNKLIIMEFIDGVSLKEILLTIKPTDINKLNKYISLSAIALAHFHSIFRESNVSPIIIKSPLLPKYVKTDYEWIKSILPKCQMVSCSQSFMDFTAGNLVYSNNKIFLIDFPTVTSVCTPHVDIALFKFDLLTWENLPRFRFLGMRWWDAEQFSSMFIKEYLNAVGCSYNSYDDMLVNYFIRGYAKRLKEIYARSKCIKLKFEGYYLKKFLHNLVKS